MNVLTKDCQSQHLINHEKLFSDQLVVYVEDVLQMSSLVCLCGLWLGGWFVN